MLKRNHRAWVEIDLGAIQYNVSKLKELLTPSTELMAIVKADAYGHGAVGVSRAALTAGASWLGVATIEEGIQLRNAGITAPILVLGATNTIEEAEAIVEYRLQPTLSTIAQALLCQKVALLQGTSIPIHLKIDTGMSRLGAPWEEAVDFVQSVQELSHIILNGVYSHLATADHPDRTTLEMQKRRFARFVQQLHALGIYPPRLHLCNTAGMLADESLHYDMVRVGLGIYGFLPAPHFAGNVSLRPALQVKARIAQIKDITPGTGVSYNHTFQAEEEMRIATVSVGYADGLPRGLSNRIHFILYHQKVQQIGTITMDQCMIDITHLPHVRVGDVVTIMGTVPGTTAEDWATLLGTISWEILCGFKRRLPRLHTLSPIDSETQPGSLIRQSI